MLAHASLLGELEEAVRNGSRDKRVDTLRRVTDLFLTQPDRLNDQQVSVFDDVMTHLIERLEARALAELSQRLAPVHNAPIDVIRRLARNDEITVAAPVLTGSERLTTSDLVAIAQEKGQAHLAAIAGRKRLDEAVTDVLVDRGDREVVRTLADNTGAEFSAIGMSAIVRRAEQDASLAEKIGRRLDIPIQLFRELLLRATEAVRARLIATAAPGVQDEIRAVLAKVASDVGRQVRREPNFEAAMPVVRAMKTAGDLTERALMDFLRRDDDDKLIAGLALLCGIACELLDEVLHAHRGEAMLIPCRAANLTWPAVRQMCRRYAYRTAPDAEIDQVQWDYGKLSMTTAQRVLRFWQIRHTTPSAAGGEGGPPLGATA